MEMTNLNLNDDITPEILSRIKAHVAELWAQANATDTREISAADEAKEVAERAAVDRLNEGGVRVEKSSAQIETDRFNQDALDAERRARMLQTDADAVRIARLSREPQAPPPVPQPVEAKVEEKPRTKQERLERAQHWQETRKIKPSPQVRADTEQRRAEERERLDRMRRELIAEGFSAEEIKF